MKKSNKEIMNKTLIAIEKVILLAVKRLSKLEKNTSALPKKKYKKKKIKQVDAQ